MRRIIWVSFVLLDTQLYKTYLLEILRHLSERGYYARLLAVRSRDKLRFQDPTLHIIQVPIRYMPVVSPLIYTFILLLYLPFYAVFSKSDFLIAQSDPSIFGVLSAIPLSRLNRFKLVLDIRTPPETAGPGSLFQRIWYNFSVCLAKSFFDGITVVSPMLKQEICKEFHISSAFVGVWSNAASTSLFESEKFSRYREELRSKFDLSERFVVFYHGDLSKNRAIIETVEAISIVKERHPDIVLFLLGKGPIEPELKSLIKENQIQANVILHDAVDYHDVPKYLAIADVGVVPLPNSAYWRHQCPLKLLEYLAMKKVVIVTDIPANREIIGDKKFGIYVSSTAPNDIAEGIEYAYGNRDRLTEWGELGLETIAKRYTWSEKARELDFFMSSMKGSGSK